MGGEARERREASESCARKKAKNIRHADVRKKKKNSHRISLFQKKKKKLQAKKPAAKKVAVKKVAAKKAPAKKPAAKSKLEEIGRGRRDAAEAANRFRC